MGRLEDGRAVFVPFGLPGERVRIHLTEEKRNFARGELIEILDPLSKANRSTVYPFWHVRGMSLPASSL